jgi:hypothetical protein
MNQPSEASAPMSQTVSDQQPLLSSAPWWMFAGSLLAFPCISHILVNACFAAGIRVPATLAPVAILLALGTGEFLGRQSRLSLRARLQVLAATIVVCAVAIGLAAWFFDMSWDGLWYHQTAVYQMSHGWNPLYDPMHAFVPHLQDWVRHYAKGPWYFALALYTATGNIEAAKAAPWIALAAAFAAANGALLDYGFRRWTAMLLAFFIAFNPVVVFELASFLVDGLMISYLACFLASLFVWIRRPTASSYWLMGVSSILCVNAKFTGLVYMCFALVGIGLYLVLARRDILRRFATFQVAVVLVGVLVFGFNPYVTNTVNRHYPFYPILGTAEFPSLAQQGEDPIERWETPDNMVGTSRFVRLGYALFGRPGAQPYYPGRNAILMFPFDVSWTDFSIYYFHDVRISGFGPLFSGAFLAGLGLIALTWKRPGIPLTVIGIAVGTIVASLLVSEHTWWARYGPQLWWIPIIGLIAGFAHYGGRAVRILTVGLASLLLVNILPISLVHFQWEISATETSHQQMRQLAGRKGLDVDFQYFGEPFGERLKNAGVPFTRADTLHCQNPVELMSVSPGYPCAVRVCGE